MWVRLGRTLRRITCGPAPHLSASCGARYTPFSQFPALCRCLSTMAEVLDKVTDIDIDEGTFKYVLIKVCHSPPAPAAETSKYIVRGYTSADYHSDVYDRVTPNIEGLGLDCECVGGGRICHQPAEKSIKVYGYSQGYGKADHSITVGLLKKKYPGYGSVTFSNDGY